MRNLFRTVARIIPRSQRAKLGVFLRYFNEKQDHDVYIGTVTTISFILSIIIGISGYGLGKSFFLFFFISLAIINAGVYSVIALLVDREARLIEASLPDALQLMASNLRSGMTPDKALLLASRPEFGPLKAEIDYVGKQVTLGKSIGAAMLEMASHVRSKKLLRAVELINSGLESGGSLSNLLEATAGHLQEQTLVDKKIKAAITMYIIFIFSAAAMITPVLLGLSSTLVEILRSSLSQIDIPSSAASALPIKVSKIELTKEFLNMYIMIFLVVNGFLASSLLGLIAKGKQREGLRYFVPMILLAIPLFLLAKAGIQSILSGLFNFT